MNTIGKSHKKLKSTGRKKAKMGKVHRTTFDRRKKVYKIAYHYVEDLEYPTKIQRLFLVGGNPFWYNLILIITLIDAMLYMHAPMIGHNRLIISNKKYQIMFEIIVILFKAADIFLAIVVDYVMKLESHNEARRPIWVLVCEIIGAIPFYPPVPMIVIKMCHLIKIVRLLYHSYVMRISLRYHVVARVAIFALNLFICETIYAWLYFHMVAWEPSWKTYVQLFEVASACMLGKGGIVSMEHHYSDSIWSHEVPLAWGIMLLMFIFLKPTLCDIIYLLTMENENKFKYIFKVQYFESVMVKKYNCNPVAYKSIMAYLRNYWDERLGCIVTPEIEQSIAKIFPRALIMEMSVDVLYDFFRHSQIMRNIEIPAIRNLAYKIQNKLYMKGEYVYTKRQLVDYMVFIQSGVIDILSMENADAAILSLTAGTVLGETGLIYPFKSTVNIRCQTICQIFVLHKNDFIFLIRYYPNVYKVMLKIINSRLEIAKRVQHAKENQPNPNVIEEQIVWLKGQVHNYMATDPNVEEYHLLKNIYLGPFLRKLVSKQNPLCHTVRCLDMLSIKRRVDVAFDLTFIRSKCIWIMKPDSPVFKVWHGLIAILAFIMLLIEPFVVFHGEMTVLIIFDVAISFFFAVDLLLSLITPVSSKSDAITLTKIVQERCRTYGLYLDICSVVRFKLFGHVFPFAQAKWLFVCQAVKIWKVYRILNEWGKNFKLNLLMQKYCVFVFSQFIYVYTLGYILFLAGIIIAPMDPVGIQISTGVGFKIMPGLLKISILYAFINTFAALFEALGIVSVTSANYMKYIRVSRIYRSLQRLYYLSKRKPDSQLFKRLNSFLNTQIADNSAFICAYDVSRFYNFPVYYNELLKTQIYLSSLLEQPLFKLVPKEIIKRVSASADIRILHQHSLIVSYGSKTDIIYILMRGEARTVYADKFYKTKILTPINLLEVLFDMPCPSNIVAITEVEVVSFPYTVFLKHLAAYKQHLLAMNAAIERNRAEVKACLNTIINGKQMVIKTLQREHTNSFITFNLKNVYEDSFEEYDYYTPFDQISCGILQFLLLKTTILPNGRFIFYWEIVRCIFAYLTCIVFFIPPISLKSLDHPFTYVLIFLDATAWVDMYVRFHVCYYNDKGVLITHPLFTAKNYLKNAFVVDFIASFPLYLLVHSSPQYKIFLNMAHLLQSYRMVLFKLHFFYTSYVFDYIFILLTIIYPVNFLTCLIFVLDCYDWQDEENASLTCTNFKYGSQLEDYITVAYVIMSAITCSGTASIVNFKNVDPVILHIISVCSFVSTFIRIYVTAYLFGSYNKIYMGTHKMRDKIRRLIAFLKQNKVRPYLRKQFRIYYELKWRWLIRIYPFYVLKNLNPALRTDMIYCLFGEHMHEYTSLEDISNRLQNFYKNIFYNSEPLIIPKNGYILTINDVQPYVYFISKGSVDVVAANGTVIETIYDGAIIGNLDPVKYSRQRVSFVTNTVTKLLYVESLEFHKIMAQYPKINKSYRDLKNRNFYYIPSDYEEDEYQKAQSSWTTKELKAGYQKYRMYYILSWFHFVFPCCIGLAMELYQIATGEMHYTFLATQYAFDVIHLVHQFLKFSTPYMSQQQDFIMHPLQIKAHSMGKKRYLYKLYFLNLPFDLPLLVVLLLFQEDLIKWSILFSLLRLNRLSRFINVAHIYRNGSKRVSSFSRTFRLFLLFLCLIYSSCILGTILALSDFTYTYYLDKDKSQIIAEMPVEHLKTSRHGTWLDRIVLYVRYWFVSLLLHTFSHDDLYYPQESYFELLFMVIYLYVILFESFVMVQYYHILMESTTLIKIVYAIRRYVNVYYNIPESAFVLRESVNEALYHYYIVKSVADDYLLMTDCPMYLRDAATTSMYGYFFNKHPYFGGCHPDFLRQVVSRMRMILYPINGIIANRWDCHDTMYFVHKGEVAAVQYEDDCTSDALYVYCKGDSFGLLQGFKSVPFQYTYRTLMFCEILELSWSECTYLLEFFPMSAAHLSRVIQSGLKHYLQTSGQTTRIRKKRI